MCARCVTLRKSLSIKGLHTHGGIRVGAGLTFLAGVT